MTRELRRNDAWPVGTQIQFVDAWGNNLTTGKVVAVKCDVFSLCADDARGVRYHLRTDRIRTSVSENESLSIPKYDFSDLL
jgi:hypothetical protein